MYQEKLNRFSVFAVIMALALFFVTGLSVIFTQSQSSSAAEEKAESLLSGSGEEPYGITLYSVETKTKSFRLRGESAACVSKTVTATISPSTVTDKYVTWSLAWANDAPLKNSDISDYLDITEESQGELTATVNCYQSFRGSKAILTCTTRQGGKTATCEVTYNGEPSEMSLNRPSGITQYNIGAMNVDMMYIGTTYSYSISLDNVFHDVGSNYNDYTVTVSGAGTVTCGNYTASPRGAGWTSYNTTVNFASIASSFITAGATGGMLRITPTKSLYDYYESEETHYVEMNGNTTTYTNKLYALNRDASGNLPYFVLTVKHKTLNLSAQVKFYIGDNVSNVQMSASTLTF